MAYVAAKNEPFSQRRRCEMNSGRESGTSVSPMAPFTYLRVLVVRVQIDWKGSEKRTNQFELAFATSSKHRMRCRTRVMSALSSETLRMVHTSSARSNVGQKD